ncbi:MAG: DNA-directed RNA polymerase subunit beta' [Alteromonas naphthalenivorans]|jgi:DNA-directed RNA polymerase subunit beta'
MNNQMLERFKEYINVTQFNAFRVGLASPEKMKSLSYGEVKKIETINYRTLKPEKDGLFCARIFGPQKDWECNCGKYKRMKHRGVTCEKCGVEVIQSRVRRERMGHVELVAPVCHIWYLKGIPSYLGLILDMPVKELERVIYFDSVVVLNQGNSPYPRKTLLTSSEIEQYMDAHPEDLMFKAESGAEAIKELLAAINLQEEVVFLKEAYKKTNSVATRHKLIRRIRTLTSMAQANLRPEWIIMEILPVLPPDLRPLVALEGGRFASSDLNELYRRVLNRNIRLRRLLEIEAPGVIIKNEKRMLQESVDALIDNGRRGQPVRGSNKRPLKSLSEMLRGKQGRFRQNLLGKRVDYSGRSVIVVDPELKIDQCGLPKKMALEIFKSYVYGGLLQREMAPNLRVAKKMVEDSVPEVWDVLEDVVKTRPVLLNRAPTLHRLGIQAFWPILVDGKAIKIHPLVCSAFNADFDGDTMSVHLPLSDKAVKESVELVMSSKNILSPSNGQPVTVPSQDMILGLHYMSKVRCNVQGEGIIFSSVAEVITAFQCERVSLHARIKVRFGVDSIVETTVGRVLLFDILPKGADFDLINKILRKNDLKKLIQVVYAKFPRKEVIEFLDKIKKYGFYYSTMSGASFGIEELLKPHNMDKILKDGDKEINKVEALYQDGVITNGERKNKVVSTWFRATSEITNQMITSFEEQDEIAYRNKDGKNQPFNSVYMILASGAKGSKAQIKQLVGMRGLMSKPSGEIIETPVRTNFRDGLSVFEYFISTHGARKGQADTALKTANSGYLTRRLVDVSQDVVVSIQDCGTLGYRTILDLKESGDIIYSVNERVYGRTLAADLKDMVTGEIICKQGQIVDRAMVQKIGKSAVSQVLVRSVLMCQAKRGVCAQCYGFDLARSHIVDIGATVGIVAAQSIGEPGTQLTMRTFHIGGTASGSAAQPLWKSKHDATVELRDISTVINRDGDQIVLSRRGEISLRSEDGRELQQHIVEYGSTLRVTNGQKVKVGDLLVEWDVNADVIVTEKGGKVEFVDLVKNVTLQEKFDDRQGTELQILEHKNEKYQPAIAIMSPLGEEEAHYYLPSGAYLSVKHGQEIKPGDIIAKIPQEVSKTKDITVGGLPRIAELFEARMPKEATILTDIDGTVSFGGLYRGMRKLTVTDAVTTHDYLVPRGKQINVQEGEKVKAGDHLTAGEPVLHDILRILGPDVVQRYIVDHIQEIYRLQGIDISDTHIEVVVKQMMRKIQVTDAGDADFLVGDKVDRIHFQTINEMLKEQGKKVAKAVPVFMGITIASLSTESLISAAAFQETTRILTEAAISGKIDYLYGLKENLVIGKLIPAGTGIPSFRKKYLGDDLSDLERQAQVEEQKVRQDEMRAKGVK